MNSKLCQEKLKVTCEECKSFVGHYCGTKIDELRRLKQKGTFI